VLAAVVVLAGLAACTDTASPAAPVPDQTPDSNDLLVGAWHSTTGGPLHAEGVMPDRPMPEVPRPEGWLFRFRARCTGSGELSIRESGKHGDGVGQRTPCTGKWVFSGLSFPIGASSDADLDLGPYTVVIDSVDTITSWDVEAYGFRVANFFHQGASQSPTG
jgi:hypothetical protein